MLGGSKQMDPDRPLTSCDPRLVRAYDTTKQWDQQWKRMTLRMRDKEAIGGRAPDRQQGRGAG